MEASHREITSAITCPGKVTPEAAPQPKCQLVGVRCIALFALFFGVDVEKPFDRTLDFLQIRIWQASNQTLEFMMLDRLHTLHIYEARLV